MLWALHVSGAGDHPERVDWLIHRLHQPGRDLPPGFYDGAHGIAHALWVLGRPDEAVGWRSSSVPEPKRSTPPTSPPRPA
ncbi:hypothetical protein [Streptomyces phaeochromogenes]|uniref:hypothetical protein n=1 Tax=Streptomyces phaeochromogenes TaxID=1923 RepID=UPI002E0EA991|nr:hypothetical protein OG437_00410 [Streptomyces phaeochromogenes]